MSKNLLAQSRNRRDIMRFLSAVLSVFLFASSAYAGDAAGVDPNKLVCETHWSDILVANAGYEPSYVKLTEPQAAAMGKAFLDHGSVWSDLAKTIWVGRTPLRPEFAFIYVLDADDCMLFASKIPAELLPDILNGVPT